jgi:hypothetical protein
LEEIDPILKVLESLDPGSLKLRYFWADFQDLTEAPDTSNAKQWLNTVEELDITARVLIRHAICRAAAESTDDSTQWLKLAEAAGVNDGSDLAFVRIVFTDPGQVTEADVNDASRKIIEHRMSRLESFSAVVDLVKSDLRQQLEFLGKNLPGSN